jgi:hypothetical protein
MVIVKWVARGKESAPIPIEGPVAEVVGIGLA